MDSFDLEAYLTRIGHHGERGADLSTLRRIVAGHADHIAFENLDPFLRRPVELEVGSIQAKLVTGGRGGYCFEHNLLLTNALDALGYRTAGLTARVLWNGPEDAPLPARGHMLVRVDLDEGPHLVDVGFGGLTLTGVLDLAPEVEQATPHEPFRLLGVGEEFVMQARVRGSWKALYRFGLSEAVQADYELTSWYLSNHPASHFVTGLMAARSPEGRRLTLQGPQFSVHHLDGASERCVLGSPAELMRVLEDDFFVDISGLAGLELALARLW